MAVFRVERNKGYTVMSNHHLRNKVFCRRSHNPYSRIAYAVKQRVDINISSLTFLWLSLRPTRVALIASPKALKLDMPTQFHLLA